MNQSSCRYQFISPTSAPGLPLQCSGSVCQVAQAAGVIYECTFSAHGNTFICQGNQESLGHTFVFDDLRQLSGRE